MRRDSNKSTWLQSTPGMTLGQIRPDLAGTLPGFPPDPSQRDSGSQRPPRGMIRLVKAMYYLGLLPLKWVSCPDSNAVCLEWSARNFVITVMGTLIMLLINFVSVSLWYTVDVVPFVPGGHWSDSLTFSFYKKILGGATRMVVQMGIMITSFSFGFIAILIGSSMRKLSPILNTTWFEWRWRWPIILCILLTIGIFCHFTHIFETMANQIPGYEVTPNYYACILMASLFPAIRSGTFILMYQALFEGLIFGWLKQQPPILDLAELDDDQWRDYFLIVKTWITHYRLIEESSRTLLFWIMSLGVVLTVLYSFVLMSMLIFSSSLISVGFLGNVMNIICDIAYVMVVSQLCQDAQSALINFKAQTVCKTTGECPGVQLDRLQAISMLISAAKPLNGHGYFVVNNSLVTQIAGAVTTYLVILIQFNISEN